MNGYINTCVPEYVMEVDQYVYLCCIVIRYNCHLVILSTREEGIGQDLNKNILLHLPYQECKMIFAIYAFYNHLSEKTSFQK